MPDHLYHPNINPRAYATPMLRKRCEKLRKMENDPNAKRCEARTQELAAIQGELSRRKAEERRLSLRQARQTA